MSRAKGYSLPVVLGCSVFFIVPGGEARAETSHYYFCEPTNSYFPYVRSCAVPWKEIDPTPAPSAQPAASPPAAAPAPAASTPQTTAPPIAAAPAALVPAEPEHPHVIAVPKGMAPPTLAAEPSAKGPVVFVFGAETPTIVCAVSQVCDVALQPGEKINHIVLGDPDHWRVEPAVEGGGASETEHLIIKPVNPDLDTSMIVLTKVRTYHMRLLSHSKDYMLQVAFSYPDAPDAAVAVKSDEDSADDNLVRMGSYNYVKGREPKGLVPNKSKLADPPPPAAVPRPDVKVQPATNP